MTIVVYSPLAVEAGSHIVVSIDGPSGWSRWLTILQTANVLRLFCPRAYN